MDGWMDGSKVEVLSEGWNRHIPEAHSPDRLTFKSSRRKASMSISYSGCVGRSHYYVQRIWRRHWFKITWLFCATILTSNLQVVLHFSPLHKYTRLCLWDSREVFKDVVPLAVFVHFILLHSLDWKVYKDRRCEEACWQQCSDPATCLLLQPVDKQQPANQRLNPLCWVWQRVCSDNCSKHLQHGYL